MVSEKHPDDRLTLRVGELTNRQESGRGIVRIDARTMSILGVKEGDIVEVLGKSSTGAIAVRAYPADIGLGIVRMDGITRRNAGVGIGETVALKKISAADAKKVIIAPAQKGVRIFDIANSHRSGFIQIEDNRSVPVNSDVIKRNLYIRPVKKNDIIEPRPVTKRQDDDSEMSMDKLISSMSSMFGSSFIPSVDDMQFVVVSTLPDGIVRVDDQTQVEIKEEAVEERAISVKYEDIGGMREAIEKVQEMVELPMRHPELFTKLGIEPPKGVLLYGPPGTGKTMLAKAVASESGAKFYSIAGPEIMSKWYGGSEENVRKIFDDAEKNAPSIIFIDEIDSIAPKREDVTGEVERRVVAQLLSLMDGLKSRGKVIVMAATNRENSIDPALRRPGRFDREIEIGVPDEKGRFEILQIHTRNMPLANDVDLKATAAKTYGYTGADISALCKEAAMASLRRNKTKISWEKEELPKELMENLRVTKADFEKAFSMVEPSAMREVLIEIPNVKWSEIGGLDEIKGQLKEIIEWPLKHPEAFERLGIRPPSGVLFYGPPGTGKTMLAKAVANESGVNFISIKGPEVMTMWVGESERKIRDIFRRARQVAPSIIFFDEIDALASNRSSSAGSRVNEDVVSQLLTEMSGVEDMKGVVIIAATNRPDLLDKALLRPGRLEKLIYIPAPDEKSREKTFQIYMSRMPLEKTVSAKKLARETEGYSGADIDAVCREAAMGALRDDIKSKKVSSKHFTAALKKVRPSINPQLVSFYRKIEEKINAPPREKSGRDDDTSYVG
jgi:transitional endoplasmic reticulum ATPase